MWAWKEISEIWPLHTTGVTGQRVCSWFTVGQGLPDGHLDNEKRKPDVEYRKWTDVGPVGQMSHVMTHVDKCPLWTHCPWTRDQGSATYRDRRSFKLFFISTSALSPDYNLDVWMLFLHQRRVKPMPTFIVPQIKFDHVVILMQTVASRMTGCHVGIRKRNRCRSCSVSSPAPVLPQKTRP